MRYREIKPSAAAARFLRNAPVCVCSVRRPRRSRAYFTRVRRGGTSGFPETVGVRWMTGMRERLVS
jgi:hypothetical protein